jgi:hypothetical protein
MYSNDIFSWGGIRLLFKINFPKSHFHFSCLRRGNKPFVVLWIRQYRTIGNSVDYDGGQDKLQLQLKQEEPF